MATIAMFVLTFVVGLIVAAFLLDKEKTKAADDVQAKWREQLETTNASAVVERKSLLDKIDGLTNEVANLKRSPSWTEADAEIESTRDTIQRWIDSASELLGDIDAEMKAGDGPFLSHELMLKEITWSREADAFVKEDFPDFADTFASEAGIPPMQAAVHWDTARNGVYRRLVRFKQLEARFGAANSR